MLLMRQKIITYGGLREASLNEERGGLEMIMRLKPVQQARRRQLVMHGIKVYGPEGELLEDPANTRGIQLNVYGIVDVKTGEELGEEDTLKATGIYDLVAERVEVAKVTGKDPILLFDGNQNIVSRARYTTTMPLIAQGFEGPVKYRFTPVGATPAAEFLGANLGQLIIIV